jgi:hypothetical protein
LDFNRRNREEGNGWRFQTDGIVLNTDKGNLDCTEQMVLVAGLVEILLLSLDNW